MANIKSGGRSRNVLLTLGRDVTGLAQAGLTGSVDGAVPNSRDIFDSSDGGNDGQRRISRDAINYYHGTGIPPSIS